MHTFEHTRRLRLPAAAIGATLLLAAIVYFARGGAGLGLLDFGADASAQQQGSGQGGSATAARAAGKGGDDLARLEAELLTQLRRIGEFDPTLSDKALADYENKLILGIERDPRIRDMVRAQLAKAFDAKDPSSIYFLERVLSVPKAGIDALVQDYSAMVLGEERETDFYALQGLANFQSMVPEADRPALLDKALQQLDRYDALSRYGPAMRFAVAAAADPSYGMSAAQQDALRRQMERKQNGAASYEDQFFTAQSLLAIAAEEQRARSADAMLRRYPNRGTIEAVLESMKVGELKTSPELIAALERAMKILASAG